MAVILVDGFDLYNGTGANTGLQAKWVPLSDTTASMVAGRFTGQGLQVTTAQNTTRLWARSIPAAVSSLAWGFAFKASALPTSSMLPICAIRATNNTIYQVAIKLGLDGSLLAGRCTDVFFTTSTLGTSPAGVIAAATWHYIECELVIADGTSGSFKIWVDGTQVINATSVDTRSNLSTNPADADTILLGTVGGNPSQGSTCIFDDFYAVNTNSRLGERRVETLYPTSDVAQGWTRSTGAANYALVDEAQVNGDTDYVQASSVGAVDTYGFGDLTGTPATIDAVQVAAFAEKTDATSRSIALQVISGATTSDGSNFSLAASYGKLERLLTTDPNGGGAWSASAVNALQGGPKVTV